MRISKKREKLVSRALELRPNDGFIEDSMGWVLLFGIKLDEAEETLESRGGTATERSSDFRSLGDLFQKRGKSDKAVPTGRKPPSSPKTMRLFGRRSSRKSAPRTAFRRVEVPVPRSEVRYSANALAILITIPKETGASRLPFLLELRCISGSKSHAAT